MTIEGLSLIADGKGAIGCDTFHAIRASDGTTLPEVFHTATTMEVDRAARRAESAAPEFALWSGARRAGFLRAIATGLEAAGSAIVSRAGLETGLPQARLEGELGRTCGQLRLLAAAAESGLAIDARIDHALPERKPLPRPDLRSVKRPLGPVAVFGASNFPLAFSVAGGDTAAAFAAGCPVVVKAHPAHPGTSALVGQVIRAAVVSSGAPPGIFSLLLDAHHAVGVRLAAHPSIRAIGFTGSRTAGRRLMDIAAARPHPIPVFAEMSSINPVVLLPDAVAERGEAIATGLHASLTLGVGQFCTNPGLVFLEKGPATDAFLESLSKLVLATPPGVMLTPSIQLAYQKGLARLLGQGARELAKVTAPDDRAGAALFATTASRLLQVPELQDEVFGPCTLVVLCESRTDLLHGLSLIEGQLTATVHATAEEVRQSSALFELLSAKAGRVLLNGFPTGVEVAHAMVHGGPYPATSNASVSSVGTQSIARFLRPVCYQNFPDEALPQELQEANPLGLRRLVDGRWE